MSPSNPEDNKELQVMTVMRRVLAAVIRDTTPPAGMKHPLSTQTIEDVRMCLGLITAREQEIAEQRGENPMRPYYADQQQTPVIPLDSLKTQKDDTES